MKNQLPYWPKYFLSALGAGWLAVTFFMYLQFLTVHSTPMATFDTLMVYFESGNILQSVSILAIMAAILYFGYLHVRYIIWNIIQYKKYQKTNAYKEIKESNDEVDLLGFPLVIAMGINVGFILWGVFIPWLWNVIEYLFPVAILWFLAAWIFAFQVYLPFIARSFTGGFDEEKNNKLWQLKASLTFLMVAVWLAAPVTMSTNITTAWVALVLSLFFLVVWIFFGLVHLSLWLQMIFKKWLAIDASPSLWVPIPIFTLIGVTIIRYLLWVTRVFEGEIWWLTFLTVITIFITLQIIFALIGFVVMKKNGFFQNYLHGKEKTLNLFALICPWVAWVVLGFFFVHQWLIKAEIIEKFGVIHIILIAILALLQIKTIQVFFQVRTKLL